MNKTASIEMEKIVAWALGALLALVLIYVMYSQIAIQTEGSLLYRIRELFS